MLAFFTLTCQAIKLNNPKMMKIMKSINTLQLYENVQESGLPFFKWSTWVEEHLNKQLLKLALRRQSVRVTLDARKIQEAVRRAANAKRANGLKTDGDYSSRSNS